MVSTTRVASLCRIQAESHGIGVGVGGAGVALQLL